MNPAGVGTNIIEQALPSPIEPMSPYASWASPGYEDPLERFVDNLTAGAGTARASTPIGNVPPAGVGTPLRASTPIQQGNAVGVGATTFGTRAIPGRAATPPGQTYLTAAQRGKGPAARPRPTTAQKVPRRTPRASTPSSPSDAGSRRRDSVSSGMGVVDEVVEVVAVEVVEVEVVEEAEVAVETTMMMTPHLRPSRDPPDADVGDDEPTGSSTTPRCNNN